MKLPAFIRRDLRVAVSYRMAAAVGVLGTVAQVIVFSFIGKLVDPSKLPIYGGTHASYLEYVSIGIVFNMVVVLLLSQVGTAIRMEQMIGTLESLLVTPTRIGTIQAGSAAFELLAVPVRFALFLAAIGLAFGLDLHADGIVPALVILLAFLPFLWGLGLLSAAGVLTYRRGAGGMAIGGAALGLLSGAFFPIALLPHWLAQLAKLNPLAIALDGLRQTLIGGSGWAPVAADLPKLLPLSALGLAAGMLAFRLALRRERRLGTLGLY
jgi:ABC-2 type transport system permease protein